MPLLCIVLNHGVSKLSSYHCSTSFVVLHALTLHLSIIGCHEDAFAIRMELGVLQKNKVAIRNGIL